MMKSTSRTEPVGGAPGNHPRGLRSGTRADRVPQMEDPVNRPGRSTSRQSEGTACVLRSMTRQAPLGLTLKVSMGTCVVSRSTMNS